MKNTKKEFLKTIAAITVFFLIVAIFFPLAVYSIPTNTSQQPDTVFKINKHLARHDELNQLKSIIGVYDKNDNYNPQIDGHGTGLVPPSEEDWQNMAASINIIDNIDGAIPSSVDNTADVWFPPIGNQGSESSCVCFAVGYYMKTYQEAKEHNWDLSGATWEGGNYGNPAVPYQDKIMSPDFLYHQILYWKGCDGGSTYADAMNLIQTIGCSSWKKMPYNPIDSTSWPTEAAWREAPLYRGRQGFNYQYFNSDADLADLKTYLANDNLAVISINANYYSQMGSDDLWTTDIYDGSSTNHANTIVGYDDNFGPYIEQNETRYGAFKVANSWGKGFNGDHDSDGCYWISYEAMQQEIEYYMFMEDKIGYEPELLASFIINHSYRTQCDIDVGMGLISNPNAIKHFNDWYYLGAPAAFPSSLIVVDISEFNESHSINNSNFFLKVFDGGNNSTGTVTDFSLEYYRDYNGDGNAFAISSSNVTPFQTVQSGTIYGEIVFNMQPPAAPPESDFTYTPNAPAYNDIIAFNDSSTDSDGSIVNWTWHFGDGTKSYGQHPSHQYAANGSYIVSLTVIDDSNMSSTCDKSVTVTSSSWDYWSNSPHIFNIPEGNVGIGTNGPTDKLHVTGNVRIQGDSMSHLLFVDSNDGNVGIGTDDPKQLLHIEDSGHCQARMTSGVTSLSRMLWYNGNTPGGYFMARGDTKAFSFVARSGYYFGLFTTDSSGSDTNRLYIAGGTDVATVDWKTCDFRIQGLTETNLLFTDYSNDRVGIGTNSPLATLHIKDTMLLEPRSSSPSSPTAGMLYFDDTADTLMCYDGTSWRACW